MKKIIIFQSLIFGLIISSLVYSQDNSNAETIRINNFEQRDKEIKEFLHQELRKGTSHEEIEKLLVQQRNNTVEWQMLIKTEKAIDQPLLEARKNKCIDQAQYNRALAFHEEDKGQFFINTPTCIPIQENYKQLAKNYKEQKKIYFETPEYQILLSFANYIYAKNHTIPQLLKEKEELEKELEQEIEQYSREKTSALESVIHKMQTIKDEMDNRWRRFAENEQNSEKEIKRTSEKIQEKERKIQELQDQQQVAMNEFLNS